MNKLKVVLVDSDCITFENGVKLYSDHRPDCCESHSLCLEDLSIGDFDGLEFDLTNDGFFDRIEGYGIALKPILGFPVRIAGHGYNNGYYSSDMDLIISDGKDFFRKYDISECQDIEG
jgi:hypothetical protein